MTRNIMALIGLVLFGATLSAAPVRHEFPRAGAYEVLSGDFHMHTVNSDGKLTTVERVREAYDFGYDVIAVTDHSNNRGNRLARQAGEQLGLVVLTGFETGIRGKEHMNVLGTPLDYIPKCNHVMAETPDGPGAYYRTELKRIADAGGFILYNHPHVGYREPVEWGVAQGYIQGIEVKNGVVGSGWNTTNSHGAWCYPDAFAYALTHNLTLFANSDAHGPRNPKDRWVTLVLATERSREAVMEALTSRRTIAWFDGMLWGRERELVQVLDASVQAKKITDYQVELINRCPVEFLLEIDGHPVTLPAYGSAKLASPNGELNAVWTNVWVSPDVQLRHRIPVLK